METMQRNRLLMAAIFCLTVISGASAVQAEQGKTTGRRAKAVNYSAAPSDSDSFPQLNTSTTRPRIINVRQAADAAPEEADVSMLGTESQPAEGACGCGADTSCDTCGQCKSCCRCCLCGPPGQFWVRDEYLGWWATPGHVPALVATNPAGTIPSTETLYGNQSYNGGYRSGNWLQGGMWLDCCRQWGVQGDFFFLGRQSSPFFASSNGDPILTRPFTDATTGEQADQAISYPGVVVGQIGIENYNSFGGAGASLRHNLCCMNDCCNSCDDGCGSCFQNCCRVDFLAGFRYYRFNDNLGIREQLTSIDQQSGVPVGTQVSLLDSFRTQNNFYGGELGLIANRYRGRWMVEGAARVALGTTQQVVAIDGNTTVSYPGQPTSVSQGGLLALSSNIGHYNHNQFTAIPQLSGRIGYRLTQRLTLLLGYTAIYWNNVARAGDQVDTNVNPNLVPPVQPGGPNQPAFSLHTSNVWLQGFTFGGEFYF